MSNLTVYPYTYNVATTAVPLFPGAYIVNGSAGANGIVPIYTSMANFTSNTMTDILNDKDKIVIVLPGFTLQLYSNTNYGDDAYVYTLGTFDNSGGTNMLYGVASMVASSCKLFFNSSIGFKELRFVDSFNPVSTINTGTLTISSYNATSTATFSSTNYRLYEFKSTTINSTFSYTGSSAITMRFLLVGGGGGGGFASVAGQVAGSGGGGAGAFVYGTIVVSPGDTFTVQIGNGGAGIQDTTGIGSTSSITRTVGNAASLIAGGGGSGGGPGDSSTLQGSYPGGIGGSSGGTYPGYGAGQAARAVATNKYTLTGSGFTIDASFSNIGGTSWANTAGSGGGGAGGAGVSPGNSNSGGNGGAGATWPVIGTSRFFAAGGGGNNQIDTYWAGGVGGSSIGGAGGQGQAFGTPNTGSGGGARWNAPAGNGGSGICIIAVPI